MVRYAWKWCITTAIIIWFLLFFLNLLIGIANHTHQFAQTLKDRLGMYFYIREDPNQQQAIYEKVLYLQKKLDTAGIKNKFISKKEAMFFLQKKLPNIASKFQQYNINNPFPATLQVTIKSEQDYKLLQQILPQYADILTNVTELNEGRTLRDQEARIVKAIGFSNFLVYGSYFLVGIFSIIIVTIVFYLLRIIANKFSDNVQIKKLLGASYGQIANPFNILLAGVIFAGFVVMFLLILWLDSYLTTHNFSMLFFVDVFSLWFLPNSLSWFVVQPRYIIFFECIILIFASFVVNNYYLQKLITEAWN